jgi:hypothetical protein
MIRIYYLATVVFLLLDIILDLNVRVAFFENNPVVRASYYAVIFICMALILWRPSWTVRISALESLFVLIALILNMGMRTLLVSDAMLEGGDFVTMPEIVNFMISGGIAYMAFTQGMRELQNS